MSKKNELFFARSADLPQSWRELLLKAQEACQLAYAPYSSFKVGAAALLDNDQVVQAGNQESVSFPAGICAERALLFGVMQHPDRKVLSMALAARKQECAVAVSPCGICRQTLLEMELRQAAPIAILFPYQKGYMLVESVKELLPFSFETF